MILARDGILEDPPEALFLLGVLLSLLILSFVLAVIQTIFSKDDK